MASLHLSLGPIPGHRPPKFRSKFRSARCAGDRQALFNRIAPVYDNMDVYIRNVYKYVFVLHRPKEGDSVLDVCCGSGDLAFLLSEGVGTNGKVVGLDFSKEQLMVASSRQHLRLMSCYKNIEWVEGAALDIAFSDCYFDAITIGYGLRNVVDIHKAMAEMNRVLKPASKASVLDFNKNMNPFGTSFEEWMIHNIVVPVASGCGLTTEYKYLKSSIQEFLTGKELEKLALQTGFSTATHFEIGGGLMGNLMATR
ncbi:unnamed protein product [Ilex paraguariensis]|uniref:2-phytyl-1,4-beta-naphthoquinone methyltransferase, chloroplastic n=1 Tax=Ilex paraguariensis TaxID=185542 RepID=A0ABC8TAA4_9AQUA